jgi:hypothetical protein
VEELSDLEVVQVLLALFGLVCLLAFLLAVGLDRAQEWAFNVEDTNLWE